MDDRLGEHAAQLALDPNKLAQIQPNPLGAAHDDNRGALGGPATLATPLFQPRPRAVPLIDWRNPDPDAVHDSAYARRRLTAGTGRPYRASVRLPIPGTR
jgi:hypothetical protein